MDVVVIALLLALVLVTGPAWWATRRRGPRAPRTRVLSALARAWVHRPVRPRDGGVLDELARRLLAETLPLGRRVAGDPRLVLPSHLDVLAHPEDRQLLVAHRHVVAEVVAGLVRRELGFLCVPVQVRLVGVEADGTLIAGRPRVSVAAEAPPEPRSAPSAPRPLPRPRPTPTRGPVRTRVLRGEATTPVDGSRTVVVRDRHHS